MDELRYNIEFVKEQSPEVWWYDGERIGFRSPTTSKMLHAMRYNPEITIEALSREVNINTSAVKKQLATMTKRGYIQRREKGGEWHVMICPSMELTND